MIHFLISSLNSKASSIDKGLAIFSFIVIWFLSLIGIFIFIIFMFYFLPQSYENNLKAQCFCYKKTKKALLSISDGRASSFFNTFIKIITPPPFLMSCELIINLKYNVFYVISGAKLLLFPKKTLKK